MRKPSLILTSLLLPVSLGLVACGGETAAPPADVRARISSDLANVLHETKAASDGGTAALPAGTTLSLLSKVWGGASSGSVISNFARPADGDDGDDGFDPDAAIKYLNEKLFTDANYKGDGIYAVPPELVCATETSDDGGSGAPTTTVDPQCAANVAAAQLRVHVVEDDDALRFSVQVDADHDEPLTIGLRHTGVSLTVDLDDASAAITALAPVFGETAPNARLQGQITGALDIIGPAHLSASLTIDRDVAIAVAPAGIALDSDGANRFASAAAPVATFELDGNTPSAQLDLAVGATTAHLAGDADESEASTDVDLPGLTASAKLDAHGLTVDHIGLGARTTTVSRGGQRAIAIDLNPDDGRALAATLIANGSDGETLSVSPKLDLRLAVDHAVLGDDAPAFDVSQVVLIGALQSTADAVKVVGGELKIVTTPAGHGVDATDGQCVTASDDEDGQTTWHAGVCE